MNIQELIEALQAHGVSATSDALEAELGSIEHLSEEDVPGIAELLAGSAGRSKVRKGSNLAKSANAASHAGLHHVNANNLPSVQSLTAGEVQEWVKRIEALPPRRQQGRKIGEFLGRLYSAIAEMDKGNRAILTAFEQQEVLIAETSQAMGDLLARIAADAQQQTEFANQLERLAGSYCWDDSEPSGVDLFNQLITK